MSTPLPREPLTKKARAAIEQYARLRCGAAHVIPILVRYTLEAERMRRLSLYTYLEKQGYRWTGYDWQTKEKA